MFLPRIRTLKSKEDIETQRKKAAERSLRHYHARRAICIEVQKAISQGARMREVEK